MIKPVQAAIAPTTIRVLPKLNSFTGIPNATATSPPSKAPIPAISNNIIM